MQIKRIDGTCSSSETSEMQTTTTLNAVEYLKASKSNSVKMFARLPLLLLVVHLSAQAFCQLQANPSSNRGQVATLTLEESQQSIAVITTTTSTTSDFVDLIASTESQAIATSVSPDRPPNSQPALQQPAHQTPTNSTGAAKPVSVLRPSIEEVASELGKRYLNLENENRRHRHPSVAPKVEQQTSHLNQTETTQAGSDAEQDILQEDHRAAPANKTHANDLSASGPQPLDQQSPQTSADHQGSRPLGELFDEQPYVAVVEAAATAVPAPRASGGTSRQRVAIAGASLTSSTGAQLPDEARNSTRKRKSLALAAEQRFNELEELYQCQLYLQMHSRESSSLVSATQQENTGDSRSGTSSMVFDEFDTQVHSKSQLPCACELKKQFALLDRNYVWLNCDHIQLMGNQIHSPPGNSTEGGRSARTSGLALTRFSQRDAGLQTIFSQKFHYLQLFHLETIDLSDNRLRNIQLDAFHGLESRLEYLNLANNFLGDSRASFEDQQQQTDPQQVATGAPLPSAQPQQRTIPANKNIGGKPIFMSDELNRLKSLKWLSLRNNLIQQLSPNVFVKQASADQLLAKQQQHQTDQRLPISNELIHLDLSDNLLKFVPSEAVQALSKLKTLKLNRNKIVQLNQFSKFPSSLEHLDLSENLINQVHHCDLVDLPNLIELDLSNNQLRQLDQTAFLSRAVNPTAGALNPTIEVALHGDSRHKSNTNLVPEPSRQTDSLREESSGLALKSSVRQYQDAEKRRPDTVANELLLARRRRREIQNAKNVDEELEMDESTLQDARQEAGSAKDLEMEESIVSAIKKHLKTTQSSNSEELNASPQLAKQFSATIMLNLSYNLFETIPGDSLLKFASLQHLDLSFNRIRDLDSNYLCSIYNLLENLKTLDLSGNLLTLNKQQTVNQALGIDWNGGGRRQLNKFFGCLQKLEKLILSTNRLAVDPEDRAFRKQTMVHDDLQSQSTDFIQVVDDAKQEDVQHAYDSNEPLLQASDRLSIKFGESFASKYLNTLDLSDNQLRQMPIIRQVTHQIQSPTKGAIDETQSSQRSIVLNETELNHWISSRIYLEKLILNYNYLERLDEQDFEHLFNLREIHLDFNKLTMLPIKLMRRFTSLDRVSLAGNRLSELQPLNELFERSIRTMRTLNLANNRIMEWPQIIKHAGVDQGHQQKVSASNGAGDRSFESTQAKILIEFALEELNLEGNRLTSVNVTSLFDQLIYMRSLRKLNLNYNLLNKIKSEWFKFANTNLQRLSLTGNKINSIDLGSFALNQVNELLTLDLDFNLLRELKRKTFDSTPRLRELNLAHNLIHTINSETFYQMNSLRVLKLSNNKLSSWKCEYFSHLCNSISGQINVDLASLSAFQHARAGGSHGDHNQEKVTGSPLGNATSTGSQSPPTVSSLVELDLSHNSLSQLRANSISVHTKLVKLNLSHNKLSFIPHDLFKATTSTSNGRQVHLISSLKYLNLAHNRIQTIDNINFRPLKNLYSLDLSHNELQTLGLDVVPAADSHLSRATGSDQTAGRVIASSNLTNLLTESEANLMPGLNQTHKSTRSAKSTTNSWPGLCKLRHLSLAHNQLTMINQSILNDLSPFVPLNLNLSFNYLDSDSLPNGFFTKLSSSNSINKKQQEVKKYDLIYTLKLESLDLSHNRINEFPSKLLENHYSSLEVCNLANNRIQILPQNSNPLIQIKSLNLEFNPLNRESNELILFEQKSARYLNLGATRLYAIQQATTDINPQVVYTSTQLKRRAINQASQLEIIRSISKPIDAPFLRHLNLSSNQLVWLAANIFDRMHSLQTLDLSNNQLTRLHLLNNQLSHVSNTLEYLNLHSNLFTNIDPNDFNQLTTIKHLDLSNLLSLQKFNCQFLARLSSLKVLRMFNYPQLRTMLANSLNVLNNDQQNGQPLTQKIKQKLHEELILSTIGSHCFRDADPALRSSLDVGLAKETERSDTEVTNVWFNLEELELELYNNFAEIDNKTSPHGFKLQDDLRQLLGPKTKKLTIFGLNLTSLSDDSLLGITNEEFKLKISFTSISQLPLRQILNGVAKRTKLDLDLRNNNIQTIDMVGLSSLDELQQTNNAISTQSEYPSLKLASNPYRCDCQSRPLWLWLNQRWDNIEVPHIPDEQLGDTLTGNSANYYLKFHPYISQTSDLKCFYPLKLRGKLAQHINYNDLVCKGSSSSGAVVGGQIDSSASTGRQSTRKRNETSRFSDYYSSSVDLNESDDLDDEDYLEATDSIVRITRFNRYPSSIANISSLYFLNNLPSAQSAPKLSDQQTEDLAKDDDRVGKRDRNSAPHHGPEDAHHINTKYNKHRPNIQQKHSHFNTLTNLNQQFGLHSKSSPSGQKRSFLTESDVLIITVASIAMIIMSLIIVAICLCKYRMDHSDKEQILATSNGRVLLATGKTALRRVKKNSQTSLNSSSSDSSNAKSSATRGGKESLSGTGREKTIRKGRSVLESTTSAKYQSPSDKLLRPYASQILVPINHHLDGTLLTSQPPPPPHHLAATQNFLMRSPTIRRMHGLAANATDWFKYTLSAYPPADGQTHNRRPFLRNNAKQIANGQSSSQLTTAKLAFRLHPQDLNGHMQPPPISLITGCPLHAFKCVQKLKMASKWHSTVALNETQCLHCASLLATLQQTKVQHLASDKKTSDQPSVSTNDDQLNESSARLQNLNGSSGAVSNEDRVEQPTSNDEKQQKKSFQVANDHQNANYMPPKMVKVLANQLDDRQTNDSDGLPASDDSGDLVRQRLAEWQQQQQMVSSLRSSGFYTRDLPIKSMRTFGSNHGPSTVLNRDDTSGITHQNDASGVDGVPSQIPTIDVDGRFTYQPDSQVESPRSAYALSSQIESRDQSTLGGNTPASTVATGQEDIFILVRDTPSQDQTSQSSYVTSSSRLHTSVASSRVKASNLKSENFLRQTNSHSNQRNDGSSMMNDECSRTSSPIAYGFMRSSPSVTTLSSNTMTTSHTNHYVFRRKSKDDRQEIEANQQHAGRFRQTTDGSSLNEQDLFCESRQQHTTNNSSVEYAQVRNKLHQPQQPSSNRQISSSDLGGGGVCGNESARTDSDFDQDLDQIIISRL